MTLPTKVNDQPAFCLHRINYTESSYILDCLTRDYGRLSVMVKGGKKRKNQAVFQLFQRLNINFSGKSEMKILTGIESQVFSLSPKASIAGMYANELMMQFLAKHQPCAEMFDSYQILLLQLKDDFLEQPLRQFEFKLLNFMGVLVDFTSDCQSTEAIQDELYYQYHPEQGFKQTFKTNAYLGQHISAFGQQNYNDMMLDTAKRIMRHSIDWHLAGKTLKTRVLFKQLFKK